MKYFCASDTLMLIFKFSCLKPEQMNISEDCSRQR